MHTLTYTHTHTHSLSLPRMHIRRSNIAMPFHSVYGNSFSNCSIQFSRLKFSMTKMGNAIWNVLSYSVALVWSGECTNQRTNGRSLCKKRKKKNLKLEQTIASLYTQFKLEDLLLNPISCYGRTMCLFI